MPRIRLRGPGGEVKVVQVSGMPNESELQLLSNSLFGQQSPEGAPQGEQPKSRGALILDTQSKLREMYPEATALERERDIQEKMMRPGLGQGFFEAASAGKKEIGNLIQLGEKFARNPIQSSKKMVSMAKNLTKEDASEFAVGLFKDFGKTIGFDIERPGVGLDKFDIDTAIDRWRKQPVSAIGDIGIFSAGLKAASVAGTAGQAGNKIAMHKALKRSGGEIKDMAESMAEAKSKAISRGAKASTLTPGEEVALRADVIKQIPLKELNSQSYPKTQSVQLAEHIFDIGRKQGRLMNKALDKVSDKKINSNRLSFNIKKELIDRRVADNLDDLKDLTGEKGVMGDVTMITPFNKKKLQQFISYMEHPERTVTVKDLKIVLDALDDSIDWSTSRTSDRGLKIMRSQIRNELGNISPEYDKIASGISERLKEMGYVENKIKKAAKEGYLRDYKEKVGLEIAKSGERTDAFKSAMTRVGDKSAGAALGRFELIDAWRSWNDLYGTNQSVFKFVGDVRGRTIDNIITAGQQMLRKSAPGFDLPSQLKSAGKGVISGAKAASSVSSYLPKGVTLTEGFFKED